MKHAKPQRTEEMSQLQKWEFHLEGLKKLERQGKNVAGLVATWEDRIQAYRKNQMLN